MSQVVHTVLAYLAALLIAPVVPNEASTTWISQDGWQTVGSALVFKAEASTLASQCEKIGTQGVLVMPELIQGFHEIYINGILELKTGDSLFKTGAPMWNMARIPCYMLQQAKHVEWRAITFTKSYAQIRFWPYVATEPPSDFVASLPAIAAGTLFVLGLVCVTLFWGRAEKKVLLVFLAATCCFVMHFILTVPQVVGLRVSPFLLHRAHDIALWLGSILLFLSFRLLGIIGKSVHIWHLTIVVVSCIAILLAQDLDQSQVGSTLAFVGNVVVLAGISIQAARNYISNTSERRKLFQFLAIATFAGTGINDMGIYSALWHSPPLFPIGAMSCLMCLAFVVNEDILQTYRERDYLRHNLEDLVREKTIELESTNVSLSTAYSELRVAQAEMIQNAKLASLGTLSAGIAHEINNALNYVRGAIGPLEKTFNKNPLEESDRNKGLKLLGLMKEGLQLTFDIIVNLKRHASRSSSELESINVKEAIDGVLLLLKSKTGGIAIDVDVPPEANVKMLRVGFTQILLNLISNASDALGECGSNKPDGWSPTLKFTFEIDTTKKDSYLVISDNAAGMSENTVTRIFEPFFTTKEVGKGTGLGLHIVRREMESVGGKVQVESREGEGTIFKLVFPENFASKIESPAFSLGETRTTQVAGGAA